MKKLDPGEIASATKQLTHIQLEVALVSQSQSAMQLDEHLREATYALAGNDLVAARRHVGDARLELEAMVRALDRACRAHEGC